MDTNKNSTWNSREEMINAIRHENKIKNKKWGFEKPFPIKNPHKQKKDV